MRRSKSSSTASSDSGLGRGLVWIVVRDVARGDARDDGESFGTLEVVSDPLENAARLTTELVRRDVTKWRCVAVGHQGARR
jgi:hypothetical protein